MIQISPIWLLFLGELFLIFMALTGAIGVIAVRRHAADRRALERLLGNIKSDSDRRQNETRKILADRFRYEGEVLDRTVRDIDRSEKLLYQCLINMYLRRDSLVFERLNIEVEGSNEAYRNLTVPDAASGGKSPDSPDSSELQSTIERLEQENERLSEELGVTMDTMSRMLNEYSSMFSGSGESQLDKKKMVEMFNAEEARETEFEAGGSEPTPEDKTGQRQETDSPEGDFELALTAEQADEELDERLAPAEFPRSQQVIEETTVVDQSAPDREILKAQASDYGEDAKNMPVADDVIIELDDDDTETGATGSSNKERP